jgi:DNA-binding PadR family transcriptional regulator
MHGYEVGKAIAQLFGGVYEPSPGVVYPNLQWLEDEGMVKPVQRAGKKLYMMTDEGKRFADEGRDDMKRLLDLGRESAKGSKWQLIREERQLAKTLAFAFPDLEEERAKKITAILSDAKERIGRILEP